MRTPPEIWTIGHSTRGLEPFLALLQQHNIEALADVRRFPGSLRYPHFGKEQLEVALQGVSIAYSHFHELGGRRAPQPDSPNTAWRNNAFRGYADYMMSPAFEQGMERLINIASVRRVVLMCAEAVWWRCHRGLIADCLKARGWCVWHIMTETKVQEHPFTSAARLIDCHLSYRE